MSSYECEIALDDMTIEELNGAIAEITKRLPILSRDGKYSLRYSIVITGEKLAEEKK